MTTIINSGDFLGYNIDFSLLDDIKKVCHCITVNPCGVWFWLNKMVISISDDIIRFPQLEREFVFDSIILEVRCINGFKIMDFTIVYDGNMYYQSVVSDE
jgi:hypothetical protein